MKTINYFLYFSLSTALLVGFETTAFATSSASSSSEEALAPKTREEAAEINKLKKLGLDTAEIKKTIEEKRKKKADEFKRMNSGDIDLKPLTRDEAGKINQLRKQGLTDLEIKRAVKKQRGSEN
ncbi:MAG: hypothetical protein ACTHJ4_07400 [Candidatus Nucleicultricaceae bacterium]